MVALNGKDNVSQFTCLIYANFKGRSIHTESTDTYLKYIDEKEKMRKRKWTERNTWKINPHNGFRLQLKWHWINE